MEGWENKTGDLNVYK